MDFTLRFVSFLCLTIFLEVSGYSDGEFKCSSNKERVTRFSGIKDKDQKRSYSFGCKPFIDGDKIKNPTCKYRKPFNCNNQKEGCEKNEWLGGAKWFDMGAGTPMLAPYCCSADNVEIDNCQKSEQLNSRLLLKEMFWKEISSTEVGMITRCVLVLEEKNNETKVVDTVFKYQKCNYKINKSYPSGVTVKQVGKSESHDQPIKDECGCDPAKCLHDSKGKCKSEKGKVDLKAKKVSKRDAKCNKVCLCNVNC